MAKRIVKSKAPELKYTCRDCHHSFDHHNKSNMGGFIMCRCPFKEHVQLLSSKQCQDFKLQKDGDKTTI